MVVDSEVMASGQGEIFVDSYPSGCGGTPCASNVTVISESSYSIVANFSLPSLAELTYDPIQGVVAAECQTENVLISAQSNSVVATISDGTIGGIFGYVSEGGFWLAENGSILNFVNATTDAIAGSVALPGSPGGWTVDIAKEELFVIDGTSYADLAVVSLEDFALVTNIDAGYQPLGLTYVGGEGQVFVQDTNENVTVISDSSNSPVATIPVGYLPRYAVFDAPLGELFVGSVGSESEGSGSSTESVGDNISVIDVSTDSVTGHIPVASEGLALSESWGVVLSVNLVGFTAINATTDQIQSTYFTNESLIFPMVDSSRNQFWVVASTGPDVPPQLIEVPFELSVGASAAIEVGESSVTASFAALATGGTWNFTAWSWSFGDGATSTLQNPQHTYTAAGVYNASVSVTDSVGGVASSENLTIRVAPLVSPIQLAMGATSSMPLLGASVGLFENASGGSRPYSYFWAGLPPGCVTENTSAIACLPTQAGTYLINGTVGDPSGAYATSSLTLTVSWGFDVVAPSSSPEGTSLTIAVTFTSPAVGALTYSYADLPAGCADRNASAVTCTPTQLGDFHVAITVSDAGGDRSERTVSVDIVSPTGFLGLPGSTGYYVLLGAAAAVLVGVVAARTVARRSGTTARAPSGASPPQPGTPPSQDPPTIEYLTEGEADPAEDLF